MKKNIACKMLSIFLSLVIIFCSTSCISLSGDKEESNNGKEEPTIQESIYIPIALQFLNANQDAQKSKELLPQPQTVRLTIHDPYQKLLTVTARPVQEKEVYTLKNGILNLKLSKDAFEGLSPQIYTFKVSAEFGDKENFLPVHKIIHVQNQQGGLFPIFVAINDRNYKTPGVAQIRETIEVSEKGYIEEGKFKFSLINTDNKTEDYTSRIDFNSTDKLYLLDENLEDTLKGPSKLGVQITAYDPFFQAPRRTFPNYLITHALDRKGEQIIKPGNAVFTTVFGYFDLDIILDNQEQISRGFTNNIRFDYTINRKRYGKENPLLIRTDTRLSVWHLNETEDFPQWERVSELEPLEKNTEEEVVVEVDDIGYEGLYAIVEERPMCQEPLQLTIMNKPSEFRTRYLYTEFANGSSASTNIGQVVSIPKDSSITLPLYVPENENLRVIVLEDCNYFSSPLDTFLVEGTLLCPKRDTFTLKAQAKLPPCETIVINIDCKNDSNDYVCLRLDDIPFFFELKDLSTGYMTHSYAGTMHFGEVHFDMYKWADSTSLKFILEYNTLKIIDLSASNNNGNLYDVTDGLFTTVRNNNPPRITSQNGSMCAHTTEINLEIDENCGFFFGLNANDPLPGRTCP